MTKFLRIKNKLYVAFNNHSAVAAVPAPCKVSKHKEKDSYRPLVMR